MSSFFMQLQYLLGAGYFYQRTHCDHRQIRCVVRGEASYGSKHCLIPDYWNIDLPCRLEYSSVAGIHCAVLPIMALNTTHFSFELESQPKDMKLKTTAPMRFLVFRHTLHRQ